MSALAERRLPAHRASTTIATWRDDSRRQLSVGLSQRRWLQLDERAKRFGVARGTMANQIICAWLDDERR